MCFENTDNNYLQITLAKNYTQGDPFKVFQNFPILVNKRMFGVASNKF